MSEPDDRSAALRLFLSGRDVPCTGCGYNLRDGNSDQCPECGERLELALSRARPEQRMRLWAVALAATALAAGPGILIGTMLAGDRAWPGRTPLWAKALISYCFACIPMSLILACRPRAFLRLPARRQVLVAVAAAVLTVANYMLFLWDIMNWPSKN